VQHSSHPQEERRTIVIEGRRFGVPNRYRHLNRIEVRYAGWNLGLVHLVDERTGHVLARLYPQDKTQNAGGQRRSLDPISSASPASEPTPAMQRPPSRLCSRGCSTARPAPVCHRLSAEARRRRRHVNKKMLALYGLKWNPFAPDVPVEALHISRRIESFCWRVEQLLGEGGFALVTGAPGTGKSVTLRRAWPRTTGGPVPRCCAIAGRRISTPHCRDPC
jgi:hypothetical protein